MSNHRIQKRLIVENGQSFQFKTLVQKVCLSLKSKLQMLENYEIIIRRNSISYKVQSDADLCFALQSSPHEKVIEVELYKKPAKHSSILLARPIPYHTKDSVISLEEQPIRLPRLSSLLHPKAKTSFFCAHWIDPKNQCGQVFRRPYDLSRHQMIHLKDRPLFYCSDCDKKFTRSDALKRHARIQGHCCDKK